MKKLLLILLSFLFIISTKGSTYQNHNECAINRWGNERVIDLSGTWNVKLQDDSAIYEITLPGTTDMAGIGIDDTLSPLLQKPQLLHLTRKNSFVGIADYSRKFTVPKEMAGKPLRLKLERVMWRSCPEIDGLSLGSCYESLTTPHTYLIRDGLSEGDHQISLKIDNTKLHEISTADLAHAYTNDTQIMWNGVLGEISLTTVPEEVSISEIRIYPDVDNSSITADIFIDSQLRKSKELELYYEITGFPDGNIIKMKEKRKIPPGSDKISLTVFNPLLGGSLWSEFNPQMLTFRAVLGDGSRAVDFGMRKLESSGDRLLLNGNPIFLRGTLECCIFPLTGVPPTDDEGWEKVFSTAKEWGLNHLRFHSWCPPDAAFRVADRMGFYLQVELPLWSTAIEPGMDGKNGEMKRFIKDEYERIVKEYGNHPSFCLMTVGNELQKDFDWLNEMTAHMHATDPRHLYAASSFTFEDGHGGHAEPNDDFLVTQWTDQGWVRGQGVFDSEPPSFNRNYASSTSALSVPLIEHEIGQYAVYPDLKEIEKYTGVLAPHNFEAVRDDLKRKGRLDRAEEYLQASGKLAAILYKEEIERAMKTPGVSGFQLLGLQDFPGQGTALIGLVNAFWESKGVATPKWFSGFCSPIALLADFEKATYFNSELFNADIIMADYGQHDIKEVTDNPLEVRWSLTGDGDMKIGEGRFELIDRNPGVNRIGSVSVPLTSLTKSQKLTFKISAPSLGVANSWSIWVYPELDTVADYGGVVVTRDIDEALKFLEQGRKVLLSPDLASINATRSKFVPVFWSPVHFPKEAGAMGVTCKAHHQALASFPNDGHTDWQWWHVLKNSAYVSLDDFPGAEPIIEMVDNFTTNRPLAIMMEAKVGKGKLLLSTADILTEGQHFTRRQLLESVLNYMNSSDFNPTGELEPSALKKLSVNK